MNLEGDGPRLIEKARAGLVFKAGDYLGLADGILELYNNKANREKFGNSGRDYVEKHLSAVIAAERYERLFEK
jgi:glycosyltransferase involved in cell wall biosynthesis